MNTIDGPTKLFRQDAILGGLSIGQWTLPLDLLLLNMHKPITNERSSVYSDRHNRMSLNTKDYFIKQIKHFSKAVVFLAYAKCQS